MRDNYTYRVHQDIRQAPTIGVRLLTGFVMRLGLPGPKKHRGAAQEMSVC